MRGSRVESFRGPIHQPEQSDSERAANRVEEVFSITVTRQAMTGRYNCTPWVREYARLAGVTGAIYRFVDESAISRLAAMVMHGERRIGEILLAAAASNHVRRVADAGKRSRSSRPTAPRCSCAARTGSGGASRWATCARRPSDRDNLA